MQRFRKIIFWLHLAAGVVAGLVILVMSVTGVLLMYERQILEWADRGYRSGPPAPGAERLPVESLVARALEARPGVHPASIALQSDLEAPAAVSLGRGRNLYMNPYTGEVLGEGSPKARAFFRAVTDWHRWLGAGEENRDAGKAVTGACNLAFLFLVVTGPYLWLPRIWNRRQVRNVAWFRRSLAGKARDFNWHNVLGLWTAVPLFFVVFTAATISYPWATNLLYRMVGDEPPPARSGPSPGGPEEEVSLDGLNGLWAVAERQVPGWRSLTARIPAGADTAEAPVTFTIAAGHRGRPDLRSQLTLKRTGEIETWEPFASQTPGRRLRSWARWVHTGEAGGLLGQTVAGIASGGAAVLVWTGLALSWRRFLQRFFSRRGARKQISLELEENA
ncbi:MAG TPA: PepSY-associated TM helix domain-containing protein [Thermoanaerobaculia bacterium]|nr:PepSY-associated TM helix domain-containing protein [Thermoanaerobaculia bacterium]